MRGARRDQWLCSINHESCCDVKSCTERLLVFRYRTYNIAVGCMHHTRCIKIEPDAGGKKIKDS